MTHAVIEILEIIDVHEKHTNVASILGGAFQCMVEKNEQLPAIRKMGQGIVSRQMLQLTGALLDLFLEMLLIVAGHVSCGRELLGHAVEARAQRVELFESAARNTHVDVAVGDSFGRSEHAADREDDAANRRHGNGQ